MQGQGTFVHKRLDAAMLVTAFPFSDSTQAYAKSRSNSCGRHAVQSPNHFLSTFGRKSGIFMAVHPFPRPLVGFGVGTSNLAKEERVNNLLEHNTI